MIEPIGVVGIGKVGGTVSEALEGAGLEIRRYDRYLDVGRPEELAGCLIVFVCVPTPSLPGSGFDLKEIWSAAREIEPFLRTGTILALKSTVPPGTNDQLAAAFERLEFASIPEFLIASRPAETFTHPDRVVIGARSEVTAARLSDVMHRVAPVAPVVILTPLEAELTKLCSNALLAAKVATANALSDICEGYRASWPRIQAAVGLDRRIGPDHLTVTPERGFGGACLPKDLDGLVAAARTVGHRPSLLEEIADYNRRIRRDEAAGDVRIHAAHEAHDRGDRGGTVHKEASYACFEIGPSQEESGNGASSP
ncbi:MAG: hypothetical protein ACRDKZ_05230 [Actinomycetota bacterium]